MKKKYEPVTCIKREKFIEIHNTIASKSAICKSFGARWDPEEKVWLWKSSKKHPTFDIDKFIGEYNNGAYNAESKAAYWAHRKQVDIIKANNEKEKVRWRQGQVPIDENSSEDEQKQKRQAVLCPTRNDDVFVCSYGQIPCDCRTCIANKTFAHFYDDGKCSTFGYVIGKKQAVQKTFTLISEPNRYVYQTEPITELADDRAIFLYTLFDTKYK